MNTACQDLRNGCRTMSDWKTSLTVGEMEKILSANGYGRRTSNTLTLSIDLGSRDIA